MRKYSESDRVLERFQLETLQENIEQTTVWHGQDLQTQKKVIVKILSLEQLEDWDSYRILEREAQALQALSHPRIPTVLGFEASDTSLILVYQAIQGQTMRQRMEKGLKLTEDQARTLATDVLEVLAILHNQAPFLVHRDIKPEHILLDAKNRAYLQGFGSAREFCKQKYTVAGSFQYMAPEQLQGKAEPASDLYALGMTLIELLSGKSLGSFSRKGLYLDFQSSLYVSSAFKKWLEHLIAPYPVQRFSSATVAIEALQSPAYLPELEQRGQVAAGHGKQELSPFVWLEESESEMSVAWIGEQVTLVSMLRTLMIVLTMIALSNGPIMLIIANDIYGWQRLPTLYMFIWLGISLLFSVVSIVLFTKRFLVRLSKNHKLVSETGKLRHEYALSRGLRRRKTKTNSFPFERIKHVKLGAYQVVIRLNKGLFRTYRFSLTVPFDKNTREKVAKALEQRGIHCDV